jgi:hypothetical protein
VIDAFTHEIPLQELKSANPVGDRPEKKSRKIMEMFVLIEAGARKIAA